MRTHTIDQGARRELGLALKTLRASRGLSLSEISERSGVAKATVGGWEIGTHVPSGISLDAALSVLNVDARQRSRLLALAAPRYAQQALRSTPLGPPVHVGQILRAMRLRSGTAQGQVALSLGVTQGHLARWESGDLIPSTEQWVRACELLGSTEFEVRALHSVAFATEPPDPSRFDRDFLGFGLLPYALQPVVLLGMEADLWRWSTQSDVWLESLCRVISLRANSYLMNGEFAEVEALARRAYGLAKITGRWRDAAHAHYAHRWLRRRSNPDWVSEALDLEKWIARLPDSRELSWKLNSLGLAYAHLGKEDLAVATTERSLEVADRSGANVEHCSPIDRGELRLVLGQPDRALDVLGDCDRAPALYLRAMALIEIGEELPSSLVEAARTGLGNGAWLHGQKFAEIERAMSRRRGRKLSYA